MDNMLSTQASKEEREEYKNRAIEIRESGDLLKALEMLKQVEEWDIRNQNATGQIDVLGHIRICYSRMAQDHEDNNSEREKYQRLAFETAELTHKMCDENPNVSKGDKAIQKIHLASALYSYSENFDDGESKYQMLEKALKLIEEALIDFPGSEAHKSWTSPLKAKIQYIYGHKKEALQTLAQGQEWLFEGYNDEVKGNVQADIKIQAWSTGILLTYAYIAAKEKKPLLAKMYATAVLNADDPKHQLVERKKDAKRILDSLSNEC